MRALCGISISHFEPPSLLEYIHGDSTNPTRGGPKLVGGLEHIFPYIGNFIIPTDEFILFRGVAKNHQPAKNRRCSPALTVGGFTWVDSVSHRQEVYTAVGTAVHKVAELYKKPEEVQALRIRGESRPAGD